MKKYILIVLCLLLLPLVYADESVSIGTFKKGECMSLIQTCGDCGYVNITKVYSPKMIVVLSDVNMTKQGTAYNYIFCNTTEVGIYIVNGMALWNDGNITTFEYDFEINVEGSKYSSFILLSILGIILYLILCIGWWMEDVWIGALASMGLMIFGVYTIINGIAGISSYIVYSVSLINFALGAYIFVRLMGEQAMKEMGD